MWRHIQPHNLRACANPLHRGGHRVPDVRAFSSDVNYAFFSARYLAGTFEAFDRFRGVGPPCDSALELLESEIAKLGDEIDAAQTAGKGDLATDVSAAGIPPSDHATWLTLTALKPRNWPRSSFGEGQALFSDDARGAQGNFLID
jgi:hypothetical protein